jgi:hypothetical protein
MAALEASLAAVKSGDEDGDGESPKKSSRKKTAEREKAGAKS